MPGLPGLGLLPGYLGDSTAALPVCDRITVIMAPSLAWPANVRLLVYLGLSALPGFFMPRFCSHPSVTIADAGPGLEGLGR